MRPSPHILVVNGTKVRRPVFVLGAPHSGTGLLAHALKRSSGFHVTTGQAGVVRVAYAFARRPSIAAGQERGAARVLRDALAEAWRLGPEGCRDCCRDPHVARRFADATPDLLYSADVLLDAFPDAQLIQVIRDGRDAVAGMLGDKRELSWFRPGFVNLHEVFPNPFLGVEDVTERARWPKAGVAVKCALRWRGSVRLSARLRSQTPDEQLFTIRYEDLVGAPGDVLAGVSRFLGARVSSAALSGTDGGRVGAWRDRLTLKQITQVERIAGEELRRLGYS